MSAVLPIRAAYTELTEIELHQLLGLGSCQVNHPLVSDLGERVVDIHLPAYLSQSIASRKNHVQSLNEDSWLLRVAKDVMALAAAALSKPE